MRVTTFLLAISWTVAGCTRTEPTAPASAGPAVTPAAESAPETVPEKLAVEHLPNAWRVHKRVISGGLPEGEAAFQELADLGVKTIISVDGMQPDVAAAKKQGMRYVHLPHGYDGIAGTRRQQLAKAVRELPGPIYIHCHHGKHRSPTAAAVACVSAGLVSPSLAETILKAAGTSPNYQGLYDAARKSRPLDLAALDALPAEFPETAAVPPLAEAMVALEQTFGHLQQMATGDWQGLPAHPDLDPAHEALLLREHFTELMRLDDVAQRSGEFRRYLGDSEEAAKTLEQALRSGSLSTESASTSLEIIGRNCTGCHRKFRDTPLDDRD